MLLKPQALRAGGALAKRSTLRRSTPAPHPTREDGKLALHPLAPRPAPNPLHIDALPPADGHRLFETLGVIPVIEGGETIHNAIGGGEES
jgi:hypothetical protein